MQPIEGSFIADARRALTSAPEELRAVASFGLVRLLVAAGRDEEAERVASDMRRDSLRAGRRNAWTETALAWIALAIDNDEGVHAHASAARAASTFDEAQSAARKWVDVALAVHARRLGGDALADVADLLAEAEREPTAPLGKPFLATALALERALTGDGPAGDDVAGAIELLEKEGLVRDAGRAMIAWAEKLAPTGDPASTSWLARAQTTLGKTATWRDRIQLYRGFIARGRRIVDRAMTDPAAARVEAFERARGVAIASVANAVDVIDGALATAIVQAEVANAIELVSAIDRARHAALAVRSTSAPAFVGLDRVARDLVDLVGGALVERERLRVLIEAFAEIDRATSPGELFALVASLTGKLLECDAVVVALERAGDYYEVATWGQPSAGVDVRRSIARALRGDSNVPPRRASEAPPSMTPRAEGKPRGGEMVVPIRSGATRGAIYADKLRRSGQFREEDLAFVAIVAESFAFALGRLDAREKERSMHQKLAVTMDAIHEGVVACDGNGLVTSANAAAARMLRIEPKALVGARLDRVPSLGPLAALLAKNPRLDVVVVRLTHGSFVVSSRPVTDDPRAGFVATLTELERAQKIAQKVVGTRARYTFKDVVGESPSLRAAIAVAKQAATIDSNVLITGESGTGKEVVAQAIHSAGPRAQEPFVGINGAALPQDLLEAELFGYERGAFTGARADGNLGKFELAAGGTILLDEIGDMPLAMQAKLLRVLQERVVTRLGGSRERPVEARVVATTHRDLEQLVSEGKFRLDLLFRLRVLSIELPTLRARSSDVALLAQGFLERFAEQQGKAVRVIAADVLAELTGHFWPGNVRELANVMEAEVSLLPIDVKTLGVLATRLGGRTSSWGLPPVSELPMPSRVPASLLPSGSMSPSIDQPIVPLAEVEKRAFLHALAKSQNNVARAAEALGVSKVTFYAKLRGWRMHPKDRDSQVDVATASERESETRSNGSEPPPVTRRSPGDNR